MASRSGQKFELKELRLVVPCFEAAFFAELGFQLREEDGLCFCLQGAARELAHEVPTVSSERLSLTFRWFRDDFLQELEDLEASLEQG